jgi:C1A family cysteine protease
LLFRDKQKKGHNSLGKSYGWHRGLPIKNAPVRFKSTEPVGILPSSMDLRSVCPGVYDQLTLGDCVSNALAGAIEFDLMKQKLTDFVPSRLFIYYNTRSLIGTIQSDSGSSVSDGMSSIENYGACPEPEWPYDVSQFTVKPTPQCYEDGQKTLAIKYKKVANEIISSIMKLCLSQGMPFVFGFTVYESFESDAVAATGDVPMPGPTEMIVGGHCVVAVGYDDTGTIAPHPEMFLCRNSWGSDWGLAGYFWIPYAYLTDENLASDFWTVEAVT